MAKKRRAFWITHEVSSATRRRVILLNRRGFDIQFIRNAQELTSTLRDRRAGIVIVGDQPSTQHGIHLIQTILSLPELTGARLLLTLTERSSDLNRLAAAGGFRDILPVQIDDKQWLQRFIFATAGRPLQFVQPTGQVTLNNISAMALPSRLTWISSSRLRLEGRVRPPVGATMKLAGPIAEAAGVPHISLRVIDTQRDHLLYRFSDAIVAEWSVPSDRRVAINQLMQDLREHDSGLRSRVFIAMRTPKLRQMLLEQFKSPQFEVSAALQKQSIVDEPRFFGPDAVLIEDSLCLGPEESRFAAMLESLDPDALVTVIGSRVGADEIRKKFPGYRIAVLPKVPEKFSQAILNKVLPLTRRRDSTTGPDVIHLGSDHPLSVANLMVPARLKRVHPIAGQLALPFPVGNFALGRLEAPLMRKLVGHAPYIKLTSTYTDSHPTAMPFNNLADFYLADLTANDRDVMGRALCEILVDQYGLAEDETELFAEEEQPEPVTASAPSHHSKAAQPLHRTPELRPPEPEREREQKVVTEPQPIVAASRPAEAGNAAQKISRDPMLVPGPKENTIQPAPLAALGEIRQDLVAEIKDGISHREFQKWIIVACVLGFLGALFWAAAVVMAPQASKKMGREFSEPLKNYKPIINRPGRGRVPGNLFADPDKKEDKSESSEE